MLRWVRKGWTAWANGGRLEINQLLFADDTALVTGSEETFGRVCKRRKLRVKAVLVSCKCWIKTGLCDVSMVV